MNYPTPTQRKGRRNRAEWQRHVMASTRHPGGMAEYCREQAICIRQLYAWRSKLKHARDRATDPSPAFVEVCVRPDPSPGDLPEARWVAEVLWHLSRGGR